MLKILLLGLLVTWSLSQELVVTKAYTDYLKRHVAWEVVDYEDNIFRGFTVEEAKLLLGNKPPVKSDPLPAYEPTFEELRALPSNFDLRDHHADCIHQVRNQGNCGSCWSFATSGMLADRCCMMSADHGLLA